MARNLSIRRIPLLPPMRQSRKPIIEFRNQLKSISLLFVPHREFIALVIQLNQDRGTSDQSKSASAGKFGIVLGSYNASVINIALVNVAHTSR